MNIQQADTLKDEAWSGMSKHCADCGHRKVFPEHDDEEAHPECMVTDNYDCNAVKAVQAELDRLEESQEFDDDHLETALQANTDDIVHFADANNTEGLLHSVKLVLRAARFEQAKNKELI